VSLAPTEAAVLAAVDGATLEQMIEACRARQPAPARRVFLTRASAALLLLVGAGAAAGCQKRSEGDVRTPGPAPKPALPGKMRSPEPPAMGMAKAPRPDAGTARERVPPQVTAGVRPPRPRPMRPSGVKTGISPEHRRPQRLDVETGSRPD
jgi:hypothetical protein